MIIKVISLNIHKGTSLFYTPILSSLKTTIENTKADIVLLQEVQGKSKKLKESQFEFLADKVWPHYSYGKNAIKQNSDHGNAILSKFPIHSWENRDVSSSKIEKRGILYSLINIKQKPIHLFCVHFSLLEKDRRKQFIELKKIIQEKTKESDSIIIAGDFNDWTNTITTMIQSEIQCQEAFLSLNKEIPKTFPSFFPMFKLDRVFYKNLTPVGVKLVNTEKWNLNSDHLALVVDFKVDHQEL